VVAVTIRGLVVEATPPLAPVAARPPTLPPPARPTVPPRQRRVLPPQPICCVAGACKHATSCPGLEPAPSPLRRSPAVYSAKHHSQHPPPPGCPTICLVPVARPFCVFQQRAWLHFFRMSTPVRSPHIRHRSLKGFSRRNRLLIRVRALTQRAGILPRLWWRRQR
jgi:hypothetical protein